MEFHGKLSEARVQELDAFVCDSRRVAKRADRSQPIVVGRARRANGTLTGDVVP